jgi:hypothetical protein
MQASRTRADGFTSSETLKGSRASELAARVISNLLVAMGAKERRCCEHSVVPARTRSELISVDDPLRGRGRPAEVGADRPQRDVHERRVERDH